MDQPSPTPNDSDSDAEMHQPSNSQSPREVFIERLNHLLTTHDHRLQHLLQQETAAREDYLNYIYRRHLRDERARQQQKQQQPHPHESTSDTDDALATTLRPMSVNYNNEPEERSNEPEERSNEAEEERIIHEDQKNDIREEKRIIREKQRIIREEGRIQKDKIVKRFENLERIRALE